ncbi:zmynd10, partial [Symbiodinium sp. KB8]
ISSAIEEIGFAPRAAQPAMGGYAAESLGAAGAMGALAGADLDDEVWPTFEDLTPFEVEHFVQDLQEFKLESVGDPRWLTQHERVEKLNWTAHNQAKEGLDEFVVDQFNTQEKVPALIYDLMLIEVWKERIWPLIKAKIAKFSSLRTYIPVYHEASVANLLEVCLYHRTSCEEAGDALVDLVDYCVRKLRYLVCTPNDELVRQVASAKECTEWDNVRMLDEQFVECEFQICMCVISIIRFLTDHRVAVPLAVTTRLLETHDILLLLVPLMEKAPWVRRNRINGRIEKFEEHKWQVVEADDEGRLPKLQSQVWLSIYNLVMDAECRARYELTSFRRENLLRLRRYINEVVVDQLPPLTNLHRALEELSISGQFTGAGDVAPTPFVVELVAEAREAIVRTYEGRWQEVADQQLQTVFVKETPDELKRLTNMISIPKELFEDGPEPPELSGTSDAVAAAQSSSVPSAESAAWEAVTKLTLVRSTASFFAAAKSEDAPLDEVLVLSAPAQPTPGSGGRLKLEITRSRKGQLGRTGDKSRSSAAADANLLARRAESGGEDFLLAVAADGVPADK